MENIIAIVIVVLVTIAVVVSYIRSLSGKMPTCPGCDGCKDAPCQKNCTIIDEKDLVSKQRSSEKVKY